MLGHSAIAETAIAEAPQGGVSLAALSFVVTPTFAVPVLTGEQKGAFAGLSFNASPTFAVPDLEASYLVGLFESLSFSVTPSFSVPDLTGVQDGVFAGLSFIVKPHFSTGGLTGFNIVYPPIIPDPPNVEREMFWNDVSAGGTNTEGWESVQVASGANSQSWDSVSGEATASKAWGSVASSSTKTASWNTIPAA